MAVHQEVPVKPKVLRPVSETRKVRKPLMERKRRERINNCLEQLALLLKEAKLVAQDKPVAKLEKADILELTVRHLRGFRERSGKQHLMENSSEQKDKCSEQQEDDNCVSEDETILDNHEDQILDPIVESEEEEEEEENKNLSHNPDSATVMHPKHNNCLNTECNTIQTECNSKQYCKTIEASSPVSKDDNSYVEGFHKCLSEVKQATQDTSEFGEINKRLMGHLESCLQNLTRNVHPKEGNDHKRNVKRELHDTIEVSHPQQKIKKPKLEPKNKTLDYKKNINISEKNKKNANCHSNIVNNNDKSHTNNKNNIASADSAQPLTLVPMRLADGAVAFLLQGDTKLLVKDQEETPLINSPIPSIISSDLISSIQIFNPNKVPIIGNSHANKLPIPAMPRKIQSASLKPTLQSSNQTSLPNQHQVAVQSQTKCPNTNFGSMKLPTVPLTSANSAGTQRAHYSISVSESFVCRGSNKLLPTIKTVSLPIGTIASPCSPSATVTKEVTVVNSVSLLPNSNQNTFCPISSNVAVQNSNIKISSLSNGDLANVPPVATNYVHILARPVDSTPKNMCTLSKLQNKKIIQNTLIPINISNSNPLNSITSNSSGIQGYASSAILPIPVSHTTISNTYQLNYQPPSPPAEPPRISLQPCITLSSVSPVLLPPTPPPSVSLSHDQFTHNSSITSDKYTNNSQSLQLHCNLSSSTSSSLTCLPSTISSYSTLPISSTLSPSPSVYRPTSFSLLSTSVELLSDPSYCNRQSEEPDEEEFIDVENDSREESNNCSIHGIVEKHVDLRMKDFNLRISGKEGECDDMWRPW